MPFNTHSTTVWPRASDATSARPKPRPTERLLFWLVTSGTTKTLQGCE